VLNKLKLKQKKKMANIKRFKFEYPECKDFKNKEVLRIFHIYFYNRAFKDNNSDSIVFFSVGTFLFAFSGLFYGGLTGGDMDFYS